MSTKIFAHRGASMYTPENTMPAFDLAYQLGAEGIEIDIHLTKDRIPVLIHDETVNRTTNGVGYIKDFTFKQLQNLDAGSWFDKEFSDTTIISLEEFLIWSKPKPLELNIELKNNHIDYKNLESIVYEMLRHYQLIDRSIISTFSIKSLQRMQKLNLAIEKALLTSRGHRNLIKRSMDLGVHALHIEYGALKAKLVEQAHQENIALRAYTVNDPEHIKRCFTIKCDGLMTDVPDQALKYRKLIEK